MIANGDTKNLINPIDLDCLDDLEMALEKIFFSVCPSFNHICVKMKNLLSYDFEQVTIEYICKTNWYKKYKNEKKRLKLTYAFPLLLPDMYALPR